MLTKLGVQTTSQHQFAGTFLASDTESANVPLVFDTGCAFSISPFLDDFMAEPEPLTTGHGVTDFKDNPTLIAGVGWVEWPVRDRLGRTSLLCT